MRLSQILISTLREDPADAEIPSHKLLARGGFIVKTAAGVYTYAPLMWRVVRKFAQIVREDGLQRIARMIGCDCDFHLRAKSWTQ